jgi:hypothetical protein
MVVLRDVGRLRGLVSPPPPPGKSKPHNGAHALKIRAIIRHRDQPEAPDQARSRPPLASQLTGTCDTPSGHFQRWRLALIIIIGAVRTGTVGIMIRGVRCARYGPTQLNGAWNPKRKKASSGADFGFACLSAREGT